MRVLVAGSRDWVNGDDIYAALMTLKRRAEPGEPLVLIQGGARGADRLAVVCGRELGYEAIEFPAQWKLYGRAAGPIRNQQMLDEGKPDHVLAFHLGGRGTQDMIVRARNQGIPTTVFYSERREGEG